MVKKKKLESPEVLKAEEVSKALVRRVPYGLEVLKETRISKTADPLATFEMVAQVKNWAADSIKKLDTERKEIIAGAQQTVRLVNAKMRAIREAQFEPALYRAEQLLADYVADVQAAEQKKIERKAKRLVEKGATKRAEDVRAEAATVRVAMPSAQVQTRELWEVEVTDLNAFLEIAPTLCAQDDSLRAKLVDLLQTHYRPRAVQAKRENFGVAGLCGVRKTTFPKKRGA